MASGGEGRAAPVRSGKRPGREKATAPRPDRADQRSRLLNAIIEVVARDGYSDAKIASIASCARVSAATFYEQFAGKEECFLAAQRMLRERLEQEVSGALADANAGEGTRAVLGALLGFGQREPDAFSFLTHEAMLAGPIAVEERERLMAWLEQQLERAWEAAPDHAPVPDLPAALLLGGLIRVAGFQMRRGERALECLLPDLLAWAGSYIVPREARRWTKATPHPVFFGPGHQPPPSLLAPHPLPRGRHRLEAAVVERIQRERIQQATANAVRDKGYAQVTVADIVASAGISREVFYAHFHDKREAFLATYRQGFEQTLVAAAEAFFTSSGDWPERVWDSGRAFTRLFVSVPTLAYLGFVESYALGPAEAPQTDDTLMGFTVFLEDGYRYRPEAAHVPRLVSEAIAGAVLETAVSYVRRDRVAELPGLLPVITYLILAPFTGTEAACEFVDRKIDELS